MVAGPDNKGPAGLKGSFMWRISPPLLLVLAAAGVAGLRDVQVSVPEAAAAGDTVSLHCKYDLETDSLYSVKWYKGRQEFFRYIPKELPHTRVFPLEGVDVDVGRSGPLIVVLRGVSPSLSGRYRCEVSADAPSFHTTMKTSYMHVVELPESAPIILALKTRVSVGDKLLVRCTAPSAHPPANLTWTVNDKNVYGTPIPLDQDDAKPIRKNYSDDNLKHHDRDTEKESLPSENYYKTRRELIKNYKNRSSEEDSNSQQEYGSYRRQRNKFNDLVTKIYDTEEQTAQSGVLSVEKQSNDINFSDSRIEEEIVKRRSGSLLSIQITQDDFHQGQLKIVCKASVFSLYSAEAQLILDEDKPQIAPILGNNQSQNNGANSMKYTSLITLKMLVIIFIKHLAS